MIPCVSSRKYYWGLEQGDARMEKNETAWVLRAATQDGILEQGKQMQAFSNLGTGSRAENRFISIFKNSSIMSFFLLAGVQHPGKKKIMYLYSSPIYIST